MKANKEEKVPEAHERADLPARRESRRKDMVSLLLTGACWCRRSPFILFPVKHTSALVASWPSSEENVLLMKNTHIKLIFMKQIMDMSPKD